MASETVTITIDAVNKARAALKEASDQMGALDGQAKKQTQSATDLAVKWGAVYLAISKVVGITKDVISKYEEAEKMEIRLGFALKQRNEYSAKNIEYLDRMSKAIGTKVAADDEEVKAVQAKLLQMGVQGKQLEQLVKLTYDWATFTGSDAVSASEAMGKAVQGNVRMFEQFRMGLKDTGTVAGNTQMIIDKLGGKIGGMAETEANSLAGALRNAKVQIDNMKEALGGLFAVMEQKTGVVSGFSKIISDTIDAFSKTEKQKGLDWILGQIDQAEKTIDAYKKQGGGGLLAQFFGVTDKEYAAAVKNLKVFEEEFRKMSVIADDKPSLSSSTKGGSAPTKAARESATEATKAFFQQMEQTFKTADPLGFLKKELSDRVDQLNVEWKKGTISNLADYQKYYGQILSWYGTEENKIVLDRAEKEWELERNLEQERKKNLKERMDAEKTHYGVITNVLQGIGSGNVASAVPALGQMFGMSGPMGSMVGAAISLAQNVDKLPGMIADSIKGIFSAQFNLFKNFAGMFKQETDWDRYQKQISELTDALKQTTDSIHDFIEQQKPIDEQLHNLALKLGAQPELPFIFKKYADFYAGYRPGVMRPGGENRPGEGISSDEWYRRIQEALMSGKTTLPGPYGSTIKLADLSKMQNGFNEKDIEQWKQFQSDLWTNAQAYYKLQISKINEARDAEIKLAEERLNAIKNERAALSDLRKTISGATFVPKSTQQLMMEAQSAFNSAGAGDKIAAATAWRSAIGANFQNIQSLAQSGEISQSEFAAAQAQALKNLDIIDTYLSKEQKATQKKIEDIEALRTKQLDEQTAYLEEISTYLETMSKDLQNKSLAFLGTPMPQAPTPKQTGGFIGSTGMYLLHRGERVNSVSDSGYNITINVGSGTSPSAFQKIVRDELLPALKSEIQLNRRGIRTAIRRAV